jgi:hypothetical protein
MYPKRPIPRERLYLYCEPDEKAALVAFAGEMGLTLGELIRQELAPAIEQGNLILIEARLTQGLKPHQIPPPLAAACSASNAAYSS